jgi:hypothetical protein
MAELCALFDSIDNLIIHGAVANVATILLEMAEFDDDGFADAMEAPQKLAVTGADGKYSLLISRSTRERFRKSPLCEGGGKQVGCSSPSNCRHVALAYFGKKIIWRL